jgi:hypothetical protein
VHSPFTTPDDAPPSDDAPPITYYARWCTVRCAYFLWGGGSGHGDPIARLVLADARLERRSKPRAAAAFGLGAFVSFVLALLAGGGCSLIAQFVRGEASFGLGCFGVFLLFSSLVLFYILHAFTINEYKKHPRWYCRINAALTVGLGTLIGVALILNL